MASLCEFVWAPVPMSAASARCWAKVANAVSISGRLVALALQCDHLRGAALDVYVGEFEHTPMSRLWSDPRVLITPHVSSASDQDRHGAINLFCDNLRAYLEGGRNVIDWERGY
jgi:glyoxylate/hydroxypyruvate reductase